MFLDALGGASFLTAMVSAIIFGGASAVAGVFINVQKETLSVHIIALCGFLGTLISFLISDSSSYLVSFLFTIAVSVLAIFILHLIYYAVNIQKYTSQIIVISILLGISLTLFSFLYRNGFDVNDVERLFFGSATNMLPAEFYFIIFASLVFLAVICLFFRKFEIVAFDAAHGRSVGLNVKIYSYIFKILCLLIIFAGLQITGIFLAGVIFITPVLAVKMFGFSFRKTVFLSSVLGGCAGLTGSVALASSNFSDSGASMAVASMVISGIIYAVADRYKKINHKG